jgi:tetratricopeptide (TPR) repeat protein
MLRKALFIAVIGLLIGNYTIAEEDKTEPAGIWYQSGLKLISEKDYEGAIAKFKKALSCKPEFPPALFKLGECYEKTKDITKAIRNYRRGANCLKQDQNRPKEKEELLAEITKCLDRLDANGKKLNSAKRAQVDKLLALARESIAKKYYHFAARVLEYILMLEPDNAAAKELLARLNEPPDTPDKKKKPAAAKPKDNERPPDKRLGKAYLDKCDTSLVKGDYDAALGALSDAVKADPKCVETFVNTRPGSEAAKKSIDKVLADLNEKIALNAQFYSAYYVRAVLNAKMGNYRAAVTDANLALKLADKNPFAPELQKLLPKWQEKAK